MWRIFFIFSFIFFTLLLAIVTKTEAAKTITRQWYTYNASEIKNVYAPTQAPGTQIQKITPGASAMTQSFVDAINRYRASYNLSPVKINEETCAFAKIRAQEIAERFTHTGFKKRIDTKTLPYATWSAVTENIAMTPRYQDVVTLWINSSGHAANMRKNTPFVCVQRSGNYYAYEGMRP